MKLPSITSKQQEILKLLYRYRFVDRIQIQAFLHHKDKRRVISWLKDLREKQYIEWIYDKDNFTKKTKPAVYYLSLNGIRFLKSLNTLPSEELRKRYKESTRQQPYIEKCLLLAQCCTTLEAQSTRDMQYSYVAEADYIYPDNEYYFLNELRPHLCFVKHEGEKKTNYLLEVFDATTPRYMVKKRLKDYLDYLENGEWETETEDDEPPIVLFVYPAKADLIYTKRRTRTLLEDVDDREQIHIRFATIEKVKTNGVTGIIWEEA